MPVMAIGACSEGSRSSAIVVAAASKKEADQCLCHEASGRSHLGACSEERCEQHAQRVAVHAHDWSCKRGAQCFVMLPPHNVVECFLIASSS